LRSAVENILRNAIRFTPAGGVVEMDLRIEGAGESKAILTICDHGPGVPEEHLGNIFRPFFRVTSSSEPREGNGLGLAIALEAVRLHQGLIVASNRKPTGLQIEVQLPIRTNVATRAQLTSNVELSSR
jgi:two-component system, OmpR family, sensor histidine kinase CpxA